MVRLGIIKAKECRVDPAGLRTRRQEHERQALLCPNRPRGPSHAEGTSSGRMPWCFPIGLPTAVSRILALPAGDGPAAAGAQPGPGRSPGGGCSGAHAGRRRAWRPGRVPISSMTISASACPGAPASVRGGRCAWPQPARPAPAVPPRCSPSIRPRVELNREVQRRSAQVRRSGPCLLRRWPPVRRCAATPPCQPEATLQRPRPRRGRGEARIRPGIRQLPDGHELAAIRGMIERQLAGFAWGEMSRSSLVAPA